MSLKSKIVIAGGSGFFGKHLIKYYKTSKQVVVLTRGKSEFKNEVEYVNWDGKTLGDWKDVVNNAEVLINLSGKSINCRFTDVNKKRLLSSRIDSTKILAEAISEVNIPPNIWLNASSGAMYEDGSEPSVEADFTLDNSFLSKMSLAWENVFFEMDLPKTRRVALRISLLLGSDDGVLPLLKKITKLGMGGRAGSGNQNISWIHIDDAVKAVDFIIKNGGIKECVNFSTTGVISNTNFMRKLRENLNIPFGFPAPGFAIRISTFFLRKEPSLILNSVNFIPQKLLENGFQFKFTNIDEALNDLK